MSREEPTKMSSLVPLSVAKAWKKFRSQQYNADRRYFLKVHGICVSCGRSKVESPEFSRCKECRARDAKRAAKREKELRANRIENGICVDCGKNRADYGFKTCSYCRGVEKLKKREKRARAGVFKPRDENAAGKASVCVSGVCAVCGREIADASRHRLCARCRLKNDLKSRWKAAQERAMSE